MTNLTPPPSAGDNTGPELFMEFYALAVAEKRKKDEASAAYLHVFKRAKSAGVNIEVLKQTMKLMRRDPDEVAEEQKALARAMSWCGRPIGAQLDIDDILEPSQRAKDALAEHGWFQEGYEAGRAGASLESNPYPPGGPASVKWHEGNTDGAAAAQRLPAIEKAPRKPRRGKQGGAPEGETIN